MGTLYLEARGCKDPNPNSKPLNHRGSLLARVTSVQVECFGGWGHSGAP